eukprot:SAG11_NODE_4196_length_2020_cov_1.121291_4_plen_68_part_00
MEYYKTKINDLGTLLEEVPANEKELANRLQDELRDFHHDLSTLALAWSPASRVCRSDDGWDNVVIPP